MFRRINSKNQLESLRTSFWSAEEAGPLQVPDSFGARQVYEGLTMAMQVGHEVQARMQSLCANSQQLQDGTGLSHQQTEQILSGDHNSSLGTLAAVAAALDGHWEITLKPAPAGEDPYAHSVDL